MLLSTAYQPHEGNALDAKTDACTRTAKDDRQSEGKIRKHNVHKIFKEKILQYFGIKIGIISSIFIAFSCGAEMLRVMVLDDEQSRMEVALRHYLETFAAIVRGGFDYYFRHYGDNSFRHTPRTRANIINDHIVDVAKQFFAEKHPEIGSFTANGRRLFQVPDAAILHFKKLDRQKRTCNYPTLFAIRFNDPNQFLPGFGPLPRLAVGYVPSKDWTRIDSIFITRPDGREVRWSIELGGEGDSPQPLTIPTSNAPTPSQRRAQPKGGSADRQDAGES